MDVFDADLFRGAAERAFRESPFAAQGDVADIHDSPDTMRLEDIEEFTECNAFVTNRQDSHLEVNIARLNERRCDFLDAASAAQ